MLKEILNKMINPFNMIKYRSLIKDADAVLLNTPLHGNLGDHAIALCEKDFLSDLNIITLDFPWLYDNYEAAAAATPEDKIVLISGGGYLGDLWPEEEYKVRKILKSFSGHRVIILPQTVSFDLKDEKSREFFEVSKRAYQQNKNLTLFVREKRSYDFVRDNMPGVNVRLTPDMAMLTEYKNSVKREGALVCLRNDKERTVLPEDKELILKTVRSEFSLVEIVDTVKGNSLPVRRRFQEVRSMLDRFAGSELVITDRLHGMVFAAVTETTCIVLNSRSHKIKGCYEWLKDTGYIMIADNVNEIPGIICSLKDSKPVYDLEKIRKDFDPLKEELGKLTDPGVKP